MLTLTKSLMQVMLPLCTGVLLIAGCGGMKKDSSVDPVIYPKGEYEEEVTPPAPPLAPDTIRVMSYNVHVCSPPSVKPVGEKYFIDMDAIIRVIEAAKPDLVALQEIDVKTRRAGTYLDQAKVLGEALNMHYYFAKAIDHKGGDYGVAILSKFPLSDVETHQLPTDPKNEQRVLALATVTLPNGRKIQFGNTHATTKDVERLGQFEEIIKLTKDSELPTIVTGDWNEQPGGSSVSLMDQYFQRSCDDCPFTIPEKNPNRTIDYISWLKKHPVVVLSHWVVDEQYASDHRPVVADLKVGADIPKDE